MIMPLDHIKETLLHKHELYVDCMKKYIVACEQGERWLADQLLYEAVLHAHHVRELTILFHGEDTVNTLMLERQELLKKQLPEGF